MLPNLDSIPLDDRERVGGQVRTVQRSLEEQLGHAVSTELATMIVVSVYHTARGLLDGVKVGA